jgi:uncharacterized protein YbjT (DUF2867 family)
MPSGSDLGQEVVVVTGAASVLGGRTIELIAADPAVRRIVALDRRPLSKPAPGVEPHVVDLAVVDLKPLFEGATTVVIV